MGRIHNLDAVRGLAILLVLAWHYIACQVSPEPGGAIAYAVASLRLAWSGVDLFFVLSGFLICGTLLDHRDASNRARVFWIRRACRILPLYVLVVAAFELTQRSPLGASPRFAWLFDGRYPLWSYATFTQNVLMGIRADCAPGWLGVTWSLAAEEQFYLVVPLLVWMLPPRLLPVALVAGIAAAPALRATSPGFHAFVNAPWRADSLLSGALLAVLVRRPGFLEGVRRRPRALAAVLLALLAGAAMMTWRQAWFGPLDHTWLAGLYAGLVLAAVAFPDSGRVAGAEALAWLGTRSYAIYLFHQAIAGLLHGAVRGEAPAMRQLGDVPITLAALAATLLLAEASFRVLEGPFLRLGHRWKYCDPARHAWAAIGTPGARPSI